MNFCLAIEHLTKTYGSVPVIRDLSLTFQAPDVCCLMAPSGTGKTTLFRILMRLERPDQGTISPGRYTVSAVFQEDRLIEHMTPIENAALVLSGPSLRTPDSLREEFLRLLPEESLSRPVSTLSGGMRRRCALVRALLAPSDLLILDEPFTGLDEETKKEAVRYLLEKRDGRLTLIATHSRGDAALLGAKLYSFDSFHSFGDRR